MSKWITGLVLALAFQAVMSQAVVVTLITSDPLATETDDIGYSRFDDLAEVDKVSIGMPLEEGDILKSISGNTALEFECPPEGGKFKLEGTFEIMILKPELASCSIDLLSGKINGQTDEVVVINSGGVAMSTKGTQFVVSASRNKSDLTVLEGTVELRVGETTVAIKQGQFARVNLSRKRVSTPEDINPRRRKKVAATYTRFDVAKIARVQAMDAQETRRASSELYKAHVAVLKNPDDPNVQLQLAKQQYSYKIPNEATYHIKKANVQDARTLQINGIDIRQHEDLLKASNKTYLARFEVAEPVEAPAPPGEVRVEID